MLELIFRFLLADLPFLSADLLSVVLLSFVLCVESSLQIRLGFLALSVSAIISFSDRQ
jgi:hypothetical protein